MTEKTISVIDADITTLEVDAVVNAANKSLLGGGGVDGAIHRAAGPELLAACRQIDGCPTGEARLTPGFNLSARHIIHTVGPVWRGGEQNEPRLLASCYHSALSIAADERICSIAFPAISTGIYGFPAKLAAQIALAEIQAHLDHERWPINVVMCCFGSEAAATMQQALVAHGGGAHFGD